MQESIDYSLVKNPKCYFYIMHSVTGYPRSDTFKDNLSTLLAILTAAMGTKFKVFKYSA